MAYVNISELNTPMRQYLAPRVDLVPSDVPGGPCWVWKLSTRYGYAQGCWDKKATPLFHLQVLRSVGRPRPEGMESDHLCCRRSCLNPDHIEYVTKGENAARVTSRGHHWNGAKTHCKHGHEFSPENTLLNAGGKNRRCRTCKLEQEALRKRKKRAT